MDAKQFDRLTLRFEQVLSRRGFGVTLATLGLGAKLGFSIEADAKKKNGKNKKGKKKGKKNGKKKGNTPQLAPPPPPPGGCPSGEKDCHGACISESDCCPKPDQETCQGKCDSVANNCGDPVDCGGCPQGQTCDDGTCTSSPGSCGPADCGPPSDFNDLILVNGQCQCKARGFSYNENSGPVGICQRNTSCSAFCAPCCPGGRDLGDPCGPDGSGLVCVSDEGPFGVCDCPDGQQFCSGTDRCYTHIDECCPSGGVNGNFSPCALGQRCCNGVCTGGCAPGFGGCNFYPCDDGCNPCTQEAPLCCGLGPPTHGTICVAGLFCPNLP